MRKCRNMDPATAAASKGNERQNEVLCLYGVQAWALPYTVIARQCAVKHRKMLGAAQNPFTATVGQWWLYCGGFTKESPRASQLVRLVVKGTNARLTWRHSRSELNHQTRTPTSSTNNETAVPSPRFSKSGGEPEWKESIASHVPSEIVRRELRKLVLKCTEKEKGCKNHVCPSPST